jgi:hypothetical protein
MNAYGGMALNLHALLFKILSGSELSASRAPVPIGYEAVWAPEPVWTLPQIE